MTAAYVALVRRDLLLAWRIGGGFELGLAFFLMVTALFPLALGPDLALLSRLAPSILWLAALLASLLSLDRLFQADAEDGALDAMRLSPLPLELVALAKMQAHWLASGLPLALAAPAFGVLLSLAPTAMLPLSLSLLAGTPALTAIGAVAAALTVRLRRGGLLTSILVLPLAAPTLIFGVAAAEAALDARLSFQTPFLLLCALSVAAAAIAIFACAAALQIED